MAYAGVDLHKNFCQTIICTREGELIKEGRIRTEKEDIEEFFSDLEDLEIAFEASSNYEYFYDLLESLGHKVVLAHPLKTRMIAESRVKTDKVDAKTLAELLRVESFADISCSAEGDKVVKASPLSLSTTSLLHIPSLLSLSCFPLLFVYRQIRSEIGNGSRFPTEEKAFSYAGLVPKCISQERRAIMGE
ncbi:MAG: transposase [Methanophagales archaeon]|nr:transposase [Methanophagales archaeon]